MLVSTFKVVAMEVQERVRSVIAVCRINSRRQIAPSFRTQTVQTAVPVQARSTSTLHVRNIRIEYVTNARRSSVLRALTWLDVEMEAKAPAGSSRLL